MPIAKPELYINNREYQELLSRFAPGDMLNGKGQPASFAEYELTIRHYIQGKAHRLKYRRSEKGKEARRKAERKRQAEWRANKAAFRDYMLEKSGLTLAPDMNLSQIERKRQYNRDRQRRQAELRKQRMAELIKIHGPALFAGDSSFKPSSLPPLGASDDGHLQNAVTLSPEESAQWFKERDARTRVRHEEWISIRNQLIDTVAEIRSRGLRVNKDTAPQYMADEARFDFYPIHCVTSSSDRTCSHCGVHLRTPLNLRQSDTFDRWRSMPDRCEVLDDIPDSVFWPAGHPDTLSDDNVTLK